MLSFATSSATERVRSITPLAALYEWSGVAA
jgi:hypothetical protein